MLTFTVPLNMAEVTHDRVDSKLVEAAIVAYIRGSLYIKACM